MNTQLEEKRQELEGLESQRKDLEATISDLLRIQSRYKGPQSVSLRRRSNGAGSDVRYAADGQSSGSFGSHAADAWRYAYPEAPAADGYSAAAARASATWDAREWAGLNAAATYAFTASFTSLASGSRNYCHVVHMVL